MSSFTRRNLPHITQENGIYFITNRLHGSLPRNKVEGIQAKFNKEPLFKQRDHRIARKQHFRFHYYEELLDSATNGPTWLADPRIANEWHKALMFFDQKRYEVICSTIMPNHVHYIFTKLQQAIGKVNQSTKGFSASRSNKILERSGPFWQRESFDRLIRSEEDLKSKIKYVLNNPVKANIIKKWDEYEFNYLSPEYAKYMK